MKLLEYVSKAHGGQTALGAAIGVQPQLIWQWSNGIRQVPLERCVPIEVATGRQVMRWDLRPTDWHRIWPELIGTEGAPAIPELAKAA